VRPLERALTSISLMQDQSAISRRHDRRIHDMRTVVLNMIEEAARHAGHLDVARELIDGRTGLRPR